jgi:hypothetical protein
LTAKAAIGLQSKQHRRKGNIKHCEGLVSKGLSRLTSGPSHPSWRLHSEAVWWLCWGVC